MRRFRRLHHGERAELVEHLGELRRRILVAALALVAGSAVAFTFRAHLFELLNRPLPGDREPVTLGVTEPFMNSLKVSVYAGFCLALPVVSWQIWAFLAPAVEQGARRAVATLVTAATGLFAVGLAFSYAIVLPAAIRFLITFDANLYDIQIRASEYYSFVALALVSVALVFELPVVLLGLVRFKLLTAARLRRNRRIGYAAMATLAVLLPGVDPISTSIMMLPLFALFESSVWLAHVYERRWQPVPPLALDS
ncbi:MAG: twin-arginine translocase subunit TatC [Gaiellaceae bacterium]